MKRKIKYNVNGKEVQREYNYIPFRYIIAVFLTVIEVLAVIAAVALLSYYVPYFYLACWVTEIACIINIIASDDNPDYKVPWLLLVMILPIAGFMLYFMFYSRTLQKRFVRRLEELKHHSYQKDDSALLDKLKKENRHAYGQARLLKELSGATLFTNTRQEYFALGEDMYKSMLEDLRYAEKFVFLEYFIIEEGKFWGSILEILKGKAEQGVEVRVVYDDIGCMATLPGNYAKMLSKYGIDATPFSRLRGNADSEFNNRSHRKILVIDGTVGYTGGINVADEYINEKERFGHWKDTGVRLEGEAVWELTRLFLVDYGINVKKIPKARFDYFPKSNIVAEGYIVPFGDGPNPIYPRRVAKSAIESMLAAASEYVYMSTPYLIIDNDLCVSIENAAARGVAVKIVVPHIPDKKLVFEMTRSFYPRLMRAGVEIYEYEPGFIHAKSYLSDDAYAIIGTVNLDYRSLVHHFENGVWMYRCKTVAALKSDITETLEKCIRITPDMLKTGIFRRLLRSLVRILAPLL